MKETVAALILVCLMALGVVCVMPVKAQPYQGSITINADGSVSPSTAPIQQAGNTYTLTSDVHGSITVERSNIAFDGNGHTVDGILQIGSLPTAPTVGISYTSNVTVENFTVTGSYYGISLEQTSDAMVTNNTITGTGNGILSMDEPTAGINVEGGGSNIITGNNVLNNYHGMSFLETINNLIIGNNITNSHNPYTNFGLIGCGILFWGASNNTVYHNNFVNNDEQAFDGGFNSPFSVNVWDAGYPLGGNYWSDYLTRYPNATEIDSSEIGNTSYRIDGQNIDRYPLMEAFNTTFGALQTTPPKVSLGSPLNQTYDESGVPLNFSVNVLSPVKGVNWTGYSLDGQQNVTITGNTTLTGLSSGLHNVTVYANDTYGNMAASETVTFTIPKPFPALPVAAAVAVVAVTTCAGLLIYFKKRKKAEDKK